MKLHPQGSYKYRLFLRVSAVENKRCIYTCDLWELYKYTSVLSSIYKNESIITNLKIVVKLSVGCRLH